MVVSVNMKYIVWLVFLLMYFCHGENSREIRRVPSIRIIITSAVDFVDRRNACRVTWLKWIKEIHHGISYSFYVQAPTNQTEIDQLNEESRVFEDIVVLNITTPEKYGEACSYRRWEALSHERRQFHDRIDYFVLADDDSFICIHHLLFDAKHWPSSHEHVQLGHFRQVAVDVISIYSDSLVKAALALTETDDHYKKKINQLNDMVYAKAIKNVDSINDVRLTYGARGYKEKRYNDFSNGWIGVDLLKPTEKHTICNNFLSFHQVYPNMMVDLWSHITTSPAQEEFTVPVLSRNIHTLDNTPYGYE